MVPGSYEHRRAKCPRACRGDRTAARVVSTSSSWHKFTHYGGDPAARLNAARLGPTWACGGSSASPSIEREGYPELAGFQAHVLPRDPREPAREILILSRILRASDRGQ